MRLVARVACVIVCASILALTSPPTLAAAALFGAPSDPPKTTAHEDSLRSWVNSFRTSRARLKGYNNRSVPPDKEQERKAEIRRWVELLLNRHLPQGKSQEDFEPNVQALTDSLWGAVEKEKERQASWEVTVGVGLDGDEAGKQSLFKLSNSVELKRGTYPREVRFKAETEISYKDSKINEDMTTLLVNFDYHLNRRIELYAFIERFTDNYMSIRERYEIGAGLQVGWRLGRRGVAPVETVPVDAVREWFENPSRGFSGFPGRTPPQPAVFDEFLEDVYNAQVALRERDAKVILGMAFTLFQEFEQAEITAEVTADTLSGVGSPDKNVILKAGDFDFQLPAEEQLRIVLRPSIEWRATDSLKFDVFSYFKLGQSYFTDDDPRDYRVDWQLGAELDVAAGSPFKKATVFGKYMERYDKIPPRLTSSVLEGTGRTLVTGENVSAEKLHRIFKFGIQFGF